MTIYNLKLQQLQKEFKNIYKNGKRTRKLEATA